MKAFMSYNNLDINNANFGFEWKLATLWFDTLLLGAPKELVGKVIESVAEEEGWNRDTLKEMKKIQISSELLLPSIVFFDESIIDDDYFDIACSEVKYKYVKKSINHETNNYIKREMAWESLGIANTVKYWTLLNAKEKCTFLTMDVEKQMLEKIFGSTTYAEYNNFKEIITATIPDISEYTWDEIIDIRNHKYWEQFRNKITELSENHEDKKIRQDILEEIVRKDLIEMVQYFRPQVNKNIVKGVISNIPLPIPINPLSVASTGYDLIKEIDFEKKYGWLYFYLDNKK